MELSEVEREALFTAGDHHPEHCDCTAFADEVGYVPGSEICEALADTYDVVARIKAAARREALLEAESELAAVRANGNWQAENGARYMALYGRLHQRVEALIEECLRGHDPVQQSLAWEFRAALAEPERDGPCSDVTRVDHAADHYAMTGRDNYRCERDKESGR